jgi:hypothetical protein
MARQQLRSNQLITTFGPGAMVDLPYQSIIIGGLEHWTYQKDKPCLCEEPRLSVKLGRLFGKKSVELKTPPPASDSPFAAGAVTPGVGGFIFPHWFIVQKVELSPKKHKRRRLVQKSEITPSSKYEIEGKNHSVVPVRFVRACRKGHVGDIQWRGFVHCGEDLCHMPIWMEERGTTGDLSDIWIVCECGAVRCVREATHVNALGNCNGSRPWLGDTDEKGCGDPNRLLVRTASNAYFPQVMSVISIPDSMSKVEEVVLANWDGILKNILAVEKLRELRELMDDIKQRLDGFTDEEVFSTMEAVRSGVSPNALAKPVKEVEFEKLAKARLEAVGDEPEGDFYARELPKAKWADPHLDSIEKIVLVHKLREVAALIGFTRFEPITADAQGELEINVERAAIGKRLNFLPVSENRGEGLFIKFDKEKIESWVASPKVQARVSELEQSFNAWRENHPGTKAVFPGAPFIMLHTLSHLLISAISLECGYPLSSLRERIYSPIPGDAAMAGNYGILIFTSSSGSEGTLGSLVHASRNIRKHVLRALQLGTLCSNDPVCSSSGSSDHEFGKISGCACHGCVFISETSCERFNEFLDRALVVPTIEQPGCELFVV